MRDSKYYTPEIEELHPNFEFEVYNSREKFFFEAEEGWYPNRVSFGVLGNIDNLQKLIIDKQVRVKHLDQDDIESLGFELKNTVSDKLSIYHNNIDDFLRISCNYKNGHPYVSIYHYSGWETPDLIIKNKSELKRLLKQLNVQN